MNSCQQSMETFPKSEKDINIQSNQVVYASKFLENLSWCRTNEAIKMTFLAAPPTNRTTSPDGHGA